MKYLFLAALALLFAITTSAQDPFTLDSLQYHYNEDSSEVRIKGLVDFGVLSKKDFAQFRENRFKTLNNQASQLDLEASRIREKAEREKERYEQSGGIVDSLYAEKLRSLAGVWKLTIKDKSDEITIEKDGRFTTKNSGTGQIKLVSETEMVLVFQEGELKLFEKKPDEVWAGDSVRLERQKSAEGMNPLKK